MNLRIKEICKQKNILQKELAEKTGFSTVGLSKAITGNPSLKTLEKISEALGVPVVDLFEQPDNDFVNCPYCGGKIVISKE